MEESEMKIEDEIQEGGQVINGTAVGNPMGASGNAYIDGSKSFILATAGAGTATGTSLANVRTAVNRLNTTFLTPLSGTPFVGPENLANKPLYLSDLLDLLDPTRDVGKVFLSLPIAQFKHLPDPSVLNTPPVQGGQYDLSSNLVDEMPEPQSVPETSEEFPSLEVQEPISGGGSKSRKWSSHKKRRHTRIRTKKNKKL